MANGQEPQAPGGPQKVENPILGLFLDRPAHTIPPTGFSACNNVRIELGRVRSDLIGWEAVTVSNGSADTGFFIGPIIWADDATADTGVSTFIATNTDIYKLTWATSTTVTATYATPVYTLGNAAVNNGSTSVAGTLGTHWNADITGGSQTFNATTTISAGSTSITVNISAANQYLLNVIRGMPITDETQPGAIPNGTYVDSVTFGGSSLTLTISQPTLLSIPATDTLFLGSGFLLRNNVRTGDFIGFGNANPNGITKWYKVASVSADGTGASAGTSTLTLATPYTGTNFSGSYCVREILTDTILNPASPPPHVPQCASDNIQFPAGFSPLGSGQVSSDLWLFTNGIDPVVIGPGSGGILQYARSIPFICASLKQYKGIMVYGGLTFQSTTTTTYGTSIASSDDNLPLQMNSGIAFQGIATSGPFTISRIAVLGSTLMLYGTGGYSGGTVAEDDMSGVVTSASLVGFPTTWAFSDVIQTRGPVSAGAVVVFPDRHEFLTIDGEYRYNGLFVQVMNDHIWRSVMKGFDFTRPASCFAAIVPTFGDVLWVTPQMTDPVDQIYASSAYAEHYMEQANSYLFKPYTMRDFPFMSVISQQVLTGTAGQQPLYYAGDVNGNIWLLYTQTFQNITAPLCTVTWASRILGTGRTRDLVRRVYPFLEYRALAGTVDVTLTLQDRPAGPVTITDTQPFNLTYAETATDNEGFTSHFRRGRVASVTLSDSAAVGWVADGYDWDVTQGGWR